MDLSPCSLLFGPEINLRDVCVARLGAVAPLAKQQNARSASGTGPASVGMTRTSVDAALPVNFRGFNEHLRGTPYGGGYSGAESSRAGRERCNPPAAGRNVSSDQNRRAPMTFTVQSLRLRVILCNRARLCRFRTLKRTLLRAQRAERSKLS